MTFDRHDPLLQQQLKIELSRREFWQYCKLTSPDFYSNDRVFLHDLADKLQWFVEEAEQQIMVVNMPPRHGKSRTATKFVQWLFGKYGIDKKVMTGSYNETLSGTFAKAVRDVIAEKPTEGILTYGDIFPGTKIKYGEAAAQKWSLEGSQQANYLATSPTGTATGFGCNIMIIDDLIKNSEEAYNESVLQKLYIGDYYLECYVFSSAKSNYLDVATSMNLSLKVVTDGGRWMKEELHNYKHVPDKFIEGKGYEYCYEYDYNSISDNISKLEVDDFRNCDFVLSIHSGAVNPVIYVDNHYYSVRCVVGDGDKIVINSAELTITLVKADGTQENMFRYRDKQSDVFEKISPGNHRVMWNGSFDFDLSVIHERGEPKWT